MALGDFQLVSVAAAFRMSGQHHRGRAHRRERRGSVPVRLDGVERLVRGTTGDVATQDAAGDLAVARANVLARNDYKVPMMRNLVRRAVRSVSA